MSEDFEPASAEELASLDISYDDKDVREAAHRPVISLGWKRFVVTDAERAESKLRDDGKGGHLMLKLQVMPLDGDNVAHDPQVINNIVLPFKNPRVPGHQKPNTAYICLMFLRAIDPDAFPPTPTSKGGGVWETHDGQLITDYNEVSRMREEQQALVFERLKEYWANPSALVEETFFATVKQNGQYRNLDSISAEPPPDEEVQTDPQDFKEWVE